MSNSKKPKPQPKEEPTDAQKIERANKAVKWGQWLNAVQKRIEVSPWERALVKRMAKR